MSDRRLTANDMHVVTTAFLQAATEIHIAMCLFDDDNAAQANLNRALHAVLSGAGVCREFHNAPRSPRVSIEEEQP